jgi:hypothetical protein
MSSMVVFACSSCGQAVTLVSDDGSTLILRSSSRFLYQRPNESATVCQIRELASYEDGTKSTLVSAGLPLHGVVFADFDGRRFVRQLEPSEHSGD